MPVLLLLLVSPTAIKMSASMLSALEGSSQGQGRMFGAAELVLLTICNHLASPELLRVPSECTLCDCCSLHLRCAAWGLNGAAAADTVDGIC